jgi:aspartate racemase
MTRTVGVIGGMGPLATQAFMRALVQETDASTDQDHLHVLVDSDPSIPDRTAFITGAGPDPRPAILAAGRRLQIAGAELFVMPCNTANVWVDEIQERLAMPFVDWIQTAVDSVPPGSVVGLLATSGTIRAGHFQRRLDEKGIAWRTPPERDQDKVMTAIYGPGGVKTIGRAGPSARGAIQAISRRLREQGATSLLLACTELPFLVPEVELDGMVVIDPAVATARRVIWQAGGTVRRQDSVA